MNLSLFNFIKEVIQMTFTKKSSVDTELSFLLSRIEEVEAEIEQKKLQKEKKEQVINARKRLDNLEAQLISF